MIGLVPSLAGVLVALGSSFGCADDSFTIRGQLVGVDSLQVGGVALDAWWMGVPEPFAAEVLVEEDGTFSVRVDPVERGEAAALELAGNIGSERLGLSVRLPEEIGPGERLDLPAVTLAGIDARASVEEDGVRITWRAISPADGVENVYHWTRSWGYERVGQDAPQSLIPSHVVEDFELSANVSTSWLFGNGPLSSVTYGTYWQTPFVLPRGRWVPPSRGRPCTLYSDDPYPVEAYTDPGCLATDGDLATRTLWRVCYEVEVSELFPDGEDCYRKDLVAIVVDLEELVDARVIVVRGMQDTHWPRDLPVEVSADGESWELVGEISRLELYKTHAWELEPPTAIRYVRLEIPGGSWHGASQISVH